ncbi:unnamed protein product [Calicophoron daubneyi]|uniref:G-protein coupled receptors family 1 profile domain-containing protein n=1 Tax=Calicophoron daubneyi TaxID=300641 RepID=A0AAV2TF44_CALDB
MLNQAELFYHGLTKRHGVNSSNMSSNATQETGCQTVFTLEEMMVNQFRAFASPVICFIGIPTNIITTIVFSVMQMRNPCRFNLYAIGLSIEHNVQLVTNGLLDDFMGRGLQWVTKCRIEIKVDSVSSAACKIITFLSECSALIKAFLLMSFSVDRVYTVYNPTRIEPFQAIWIAHLTVAMCYLVSMIMSIPQFIYVDLVKDKSGGWNCQYVDPVAPGVQYVLYLYIFGANVLPFIFICVTNVLIAIKLHAIVNNSKSSGNVDKKSSIELSKLIAHLAISILFSFLSCPLLVLIILRQQLYLNGYNITAPDYAKRIIELSKLFSSVDTMNYAFDFFIYLTSMREFRETILELLTCRRVGKSINDSAVITNGCSDHEREAGRNIVFSTVSGPAKSIPRVLAIRVRQSNRSKSQTRM